MSTNRIYNHTKINKQTAQELFNCYDNNIKVTSLSLIPEGLSTSNYTVYTNQGSYLLKIYPNTDENSLKEIASYKLASEQVRVPKVHYFSNSLKVINKHFSIMQYIEGVSLKNFVIHNNDLPLPIVCNIANGLACLHNRTYEHRALLNSNLTIKQSLPTFHSGFLNCLQGFAGNHLSVELIHKITQFIEQNKKTIQELDLEIVFSHGDFNPANILIDKDNNVWFIDFEYSLASSRYVDIGKFFRERDGLVAYVSNDVYETFFNCYNKSCKKQLPLNWVKLAKVTDMLALLGFINKENPPKDWINAIEKALFNTIKFLNTK